MHSDEEFQGLMATDRNRNQSIEQKGTHIVPELFPGRRSVGKLELNCGRIGTDA
jgi:hypothetical protein